LPEQLFLGQVTVLNQEEFPTLENQNRAEDEVAKRNQRAAVDADYNDPRNHYNNEVLVKHYGPVVHNSVHPHHDR